MKTDLLRDGATGLFAAIAVDRLVDGVAAGGIRIKSYPDEAAAAEDARALAAAMSLKAALAGIRCGGAKVVVRADSLRDRAAALERVGREVESRAGALYVGPDYGFTDRDRDAVAGATRYMDDPHMAGSTAGATAQSVRDCMAAALGVDADAAGGLRGARVGIQGLGKVGSALARLLLSEGAEVLGFDVDPERVAAAEVRPASSERELFEREDLDVLAPCALGGAVDLARASRLRARALVGAANHRLAPPEADVAAELDRRRVVHVPDFLANAGAFVRWASTVLEKRTPAEADAAVRRIGETARLVLARSRAEGRTPFAVALDLARERLGTTGSDAPAGATYRDEG